MTCKVYINASFSSRKVMEYKLSMKQFYFELASIVAVYEENVPV